MKTTKTFRGAFTRQLLLLLALGGLAVGCGDDSKVIDPTPDASTDAPTDGAEEPDCYTNPTTHVQIINACTTAQSVDKQPVLPLLNADGSLPPLP